MFLNAASARHLLIAAILCSAAAHAEDAPRPKGAVYVGKIADACVNSAMSASILTALRDKGISKAEADKKIADILKDDPNREFLDGLSLLNSRVVFGFPDVIQSSQEQIALARCARFAKDKPSLTPEQVDALIPAVLECQAADKPELPSPKCVFAVIYQAVPQMTPNTSAEQTRDR